MEIIQLGIFEHIVLIKCNQPFIMVDVLVTRDYQTSHTIRNDEATKVKKNRVLEP